MARDITQRSHAALLQVAAGAVMISFAPVLVKLARVAPTTSGFYRLLVGGVALALVVAARGGWARAGRRHLALSAVCGLLLAADLAVWHRSILYVGPGLATILANFQVLFLAAIGIVLLGERLHRRLAVAIPLAVLGLFLIFGLEWNRAGMEYKLGFALGILTAMCYAAYLLTLRHTQSLPGAGPPVVTVATLSLFAAAVLAVSVHVEGAGFAIPDRITLAALLALGLGPHVVGWLLISTGLPHIAASRAGLLLLLQPALAFVWDVAFFARPTTAIEVAGAGLALAAIYLGTVRWE